MAAEIKLGAEVGMKRLTNNPKAENFANLPGRDVNNRMASENDRASGATRPSEIQNRYKLNGNTIDMMA
ncbi:MAG: hypothetical protein RIF32_20385 [Leptospirales bacterium]|jgi:hypothetical protein